jgi:uncharacterized protein (DUF1501 family)
MSEIKSILTRRIFLKSSGLALVSFGLAPRALVRAVAAAENPRRRKVLVVVFQRGACDGLNTVIPFGESQYHSLRPTIAVPAPGGARGGAEAALDLDGFFGLHPSLEPLMPLWKDGVLGVVHAVGSPDSTRSHFDAQDFMESGTPGIKSTDDGWMNRCLQALPDPTATPVRAVSLTPTLPRSLAGAAPAVAMANLRDFRLKAGPPGAGVPTGGAARGFEEMYAATVHQALHGTGQETFEALDFLKKADPARYAPEHGAEYPNGGVGDHLKQIAQLIKADVGVEMAFAEVGGWDHHAGEGGVQGQIAQRLRELGRSLAAFAVDLGPRLQDVVLVTFTEFGRTVRENGNRGTDHGHASVSFVLGGPVRGGRVHGRWPGLSPSALYEGRDLALTTDYRDLVAEILTGHLAAKDLKRVFPGFTPGKTPGVLRA